MMDRVSLSNASSFSRIRFLRALSLHMGLNVRGRSMSTVVVRGATPLGAHRPKLYPVWDDRIGPREIVSEFDEPPMQLVALAGPLNNSKTAGRYNVSLCLRSPTGESELAPRIADIER